MHLNETAPGTVLGISDWFRVDQQRIDRFADLTEDRQFIHIDPVRAAETPFGGTIAHGFLTLSMLSHFLEQAVPEMGNARESLNYGFEKLRFLSPVPAGARIRGRFTLLGTEERRPGMRLCRLGAEIEIEGGTRPALATEWLVMLVTDPAND
ncbi:MAG: MaoC family dehydratase [Pararhodobacter sp.]|nr:MaoC family dehydratase [Pararhodobacter sp.]